MTRGLGADRRGAVALMVGVMGPGLIVFIALTVDAGFWLVGQTRLQAAADAAAMGTSFLLTSSSFKALGSADQLSAAQAVALAEANGAATANRGTLTTPITVSVASNYASVTVTLYSQASSFFGNAVGVAAPLMRATATASLKKSGACVLALGTTGNAVLVDNSGTIAAASCSVASKANIYLNSGTITATDILAAGTVSKSNSGGNSMKPDPATSGATISDDPYTGQTAPSPGTCTTHQDYTAYSSSTYVANPGTWCGSQSIGGNGSSIQFNPGVYIINNTGDGKGGDLTFSNANITSAAGVTFVLTSSSSQISPGNFSWTNNSNTTMSITAPTSGATAGIAVWQKCSSSGTQTASFQGGSTLNISGALYMPCASVDIGNNAQIAAPLSGSMNIVGKSIYVHGSAALRTSGSNTGGSTGATAVLTQ